MISVSSTAAVKKGNMGRAWAIVLVVFLAGFCMPANMGKTMWLAPLVMQGLEFGPDVLGWVNGVFYILGAVIAFPAASFIRRLGIRWSVVIALACGDRGQPHWSLFDERDGAHGLSHHRGGGLRPDGRYRRRGNLAVVPSGKARPAVGRVGDVGRDLANAVTPILDSAIAGATGSYVSVWWFMLALDVCVLALFLLVYRDPSDPFISEEDKAGEVKFSYKDLFSHKVVWILGILFFLEEGAFIASQGFLTAYVTANLNAPLMVGSALVSAGAIWGACFAPISGAISDRIKSRRKILIFCMVCAVLFALTVFTVTDIRLYIIVIILNGFVGGGISSMLWTSCTETVPSHLVSGATATLACMQSCGMFLGSMFMGNVINAIGYTLAGVCVLAPVFFLGLLVAIFGLKGKIR